MVSKKILMMEDKLKMESMSLKTSQKSVLPPLTRFIGVDDEVYEGANMSGEDE